MVCVLQIYKHKVADSKPELLYYLANLGLVVCSG